MRFFSGYSVLLRKAGVLPFAALHDLTQVLGRVPYVGIADVQRCEAKAQDVQVLAAIACTEVTDYAACDQGLHDGVGTIGAGQAHLRAAQGFVSRCGDAKAVAVQARAHQLHEQACERQ